MNAADWCFMRLREVIYQRRGMHLSAVSQLSFFPYESVRRQRDEQNKLVQIKSLDLYCGLLQTTVLSVPDILEAKNLNKFLNDLKLVHMLKVLKSGCESINDAFRIALNANSAEFSVGMFQGQKLSSSHKGRRLIKMENTTGAHHYRENLFKSKTAGKNSAKNL